MNPLLTFAVPTYNRLECLRLLLAAVEPELRQLSGGQPAQVELLVCNNASTDGSTEYLEGLAAAGRLRLVQNATNIGAAANVVLCLREARARHIWICGDDDLPLPGVLARVLSFVREHDPDLLYLPARWHSGDLAQLPYHKPSPRAPQRLDANRFVLRTNVYVSFLSSWVVHRERYLASPDARPSRYIGTFLPQLEWHLELLRPDARLFAAPYDWLLARRGNSGGYSLFDTFVANYHRIVGEKLAGQPQLREFLQDHLLRGYLPGLVWGMRIGALGRFEPVDWRKVEEMMAQAWPQRPQGRAWISRIARWPRPVAKLALGWCWLDARAWMERISSRQGKTV